MKKIFAPIMAVCTMISPAYAFEPKANVDSASSKADQPFNILGATSGMTFDEVKEAVAEHKFGLYLEEGTYGIRSGSKSVSFEMPMSFDTRLYDNPSMYRNLPKYDRLRGELSSPAAGSVVTFIERSFRIPIEKAPSWDSVMAKLVSAYGEPSYSDHIGNYWIFDSTGALVEGKPNVFDGGCIAPSVSFEFMSTSDLDKNFCLAVYFATGKNNSYGLTARFHYHDIKLKIADARAMSEQMEAEITAETKETDLDL